MLLCNTKVEDRYYRIDTFITNKSEHIADFKDMFPH